MLAFIDLKKKGFKSWPDIVSLGKALKLHCLSSPWSTNGDLGGNL